MTPEQRLADFAITTATEALDANVEEAATHLFFDAVSLARAARAHPVVTAVHGLNAPGSGTASSWTRNTGLPAHAAALENGVAVHAHFQDDTDMSAWAHPASLIVPAVVAAAESGDRGIDDALKGLVAGYAALSWLAAREEFARTVVESGWRASPVLGSAAAAIGAATTLKLDRQQTLSALAIAVDSTGGLLEPVRDGAQDWRLQNGFATQRGLVASHLARAGVRGARQPLSGEKGLVAGFGAKTPQQWSEPPDASAVRHVWFKPYPTLGDNMACAVAAAQLHPRIDTRAIQRITIEMNAHFASYPGTAYRGPYEYTEQAIASTSFAVATLLQYGTLDYADYTHLVDDSAVMRLVSLTDIDARDDLGYLESTVRVATPSGEFEASSREAPRSVFFRDIDTTLETLKQRGQPDLREMAERMLGTDRQRINLYALRPDKG